ncbi:hypothetical protein CBR_g39329 [Chara braunii]|uniref:CCHC-type domain-containing protein n=1 Tax=Chara braunii TaxID=69332 RepID=A0A388K184_CHABU|nr:hypothetical protein CBR_g39329 [Chara braunii]|eukprot:GBG63785.1 hypothetical protein CBR_g39329 [Chara braunii]
MLGKTCYKCGEADHFASVCEEYHDAKTRGVSFVPPPPRPRQGQAMTTQEEHPRSLLADSLTNRGGPTYTDKLMRKYFLELAEERRARKEQEVREQQERKAEELRLKREKKRLERLEERKRYEDERDARLLRLVRVECGSNERPGSAKREKKVRVNDRGETVEEDKERLSREIAMQPSSDEEEDTELILLRRRAARININDKRRRDLEKQTAESPPLTTETKGQRTRFMADARGLRPVLGMEVISRIEEIRSCEAGKTASASKILAPVGKLALSMKHVFAGCGPGDREKYEVEYRDLLEALTIDDLKEVCRNEKISYVKRDIAIKRLVTRRLLKAYDPINVPLPQSPKEAMKIPGSARSIRPKPTTEPTEEESVYRTQGLETDVLYNCLTDPSRGSDSSSNAEVVDEAQDREQDKELFNGQPTNSTAIVPAHTPLLTLPPSNNSNIGTVVPSFSGYSGGNGWFGKRVSTLEDKVARICEKHEADEAKEKAAREEEERKKREREEEDRRQREKKDREDFQSQMKQELNENLDKVYKAIDGKRNGDSEEVAKLKATINDLQRRMNGVSASTEVTKPVSEAEELARLRREQVEIKTASDKRQSALKDVVLALQRQCEEAEVNAEAWKNEPLRPGNKWESLALGPTPTTQVRFWARTTHVETPKRQVEVDLKGIVERHQMEVKALQDLPIKEMKARRDSEDEVLRLKDELAKLAMEKRTGARGTNLKSRLDEVAVRKEKGVVEDEVGPSNRKSKVMTAPSYVARTVDRDTFVRENRRQLRGKKKKEVITIYEKEGVPYTTLELTKEVIVQERAAQAFENEDGKKDNGKNVVVIEVSGEGDESSDKDDGQDSDVS